MKSEEVELKTWPVGPIGGAAPPEGMLTTSVCTIWFAGFKALYSVLLPDNWSETQKGVMAPNDIPHGVLRLGSVARAPGMSDTRFV